MTRATRMAVKDMYTSLEERERESSDFFLIGRKE
jgi:hypothetical protein